MTWQKIKLTLLALTSILVLTAGSVATAQTDVDTVKGGLNQTAEQADISKVGADNATVGLTDFLGVVINYLFGIVAVIFVTVVMIGGYLWMTAQGSDDQIAKGKKFVLNGIFGLVTIFLSYGLVYVILFALNAATTKN